MHRLAVGSEKHWSNPQFKSVLFSVHIRTLVHVMFTQTRIITQNSNEKIHQSNQVDSKNSTGTRWNWN